jgi:hypothetical protein
MKKYITKIGVIIVILTLFPWTFPVQAAALTSMKDTMTRLKVSETADHTVQWTLPGGVTFAAGDKARVDFPGAFVTDAGWTTADFTFDDGSGAVTIDSVGVDGDPATCAGDKFSVKVITAADQFEIWACDAYTSSGAGATVTFTIDGTTPNGTLANPSSAGSNTVALVGDDKGNGFGSDDDSGSLAVAIADSEQVSVTATVEPGLTFDLDTATTNTESAAPYSVALGTLTTGAVGTSDGATINSIWVDLGTNADGGAVVTVLDVGSGGAAGLYSTLKTKNIASGTATLVANTEGYGVCVKSATATVGTLQAVSPYDTGAGCDYAVHQVGALSLTAASILNSSAAALSGGRAEILVKAAINATTPAATDYADAYTFIATGTF